MSLMFFRPWFCGVSSVLGAPLRGFFQSLPCLGESDSQVILALWRLPYQMYPWSKRSWHQGRSPGRVAGGRSLGTRRARGPRLCVGCGSNRVTHARVPRKQLLVICDCVLEKVAMPWRSSCQNGVRGRGRQCSKSKRSLFSSD